MARLDQTNSTTNSSHGAALLSVASPQSHCINILSQAHLLGAVNQVSNAVIPNSMAQFCNLGRHLLRTVLAVELLCTPKEIRP